MGETETNEISEEAILTDYAFSSFKNITCIIQKVSYFYYFVFIEILWDCFRNEKTFHK